MKKGKVFFVKHYWLFVLLTPIRYFIYSFKYFIIPDRVAIKKKFKKRLGYVPNLEEPITFNEKLQWLKLNNRDPFFSDCADKIKVRTVVSNILGTEKYLIPLLFKTDNYKDITMDNMPNEPFVIKCNHDNSSYMIIKNKQNEDWNYLSNYYRFRMNCLNLFWSNREWPYKSIKPMIMVEKLLMAKNVDYLLHEFKFYCFNGKIKFITFIEQESEHIKKQIYLDDNYNIFPKKMSLGYKGDNANIEHLPDTDILDEMKSIVNKLCNEFKYHVRIDLFQEDEKIYVGEITFFDGGGFDVVEPKQMAIELGNYLKLPTDK